MPKQSFKPFVGKRNATKVPVLLALQLAESDLGLRGLTLSDIRDSIPGISNNYLSHRLRFWAEIGYIDAKPAFVGNRYLLRYSLASEGKRFLRYVPQEVLFRHSQAIDFESLAPGKIIDPEPVAPAPESVPEPVKEPVQAPKAGKPIFYIAGTDKNGQTFYAGVDINGYYWGTDKVPGSAKMVESPEMLIIELNGYRNDRGLNRLRREDLTLVNSPDR